MSFCTNAARGEEDLSIAWEELPTEIAEFPVAPDVCFRAIAKVEGKAKGLLAVFTAADLLQHLQAVLSLEVTREQLCLLSGRVWRLHHPEQLVTCLTGFVHVRQADASALHVSMQANDWPSLLPTLSKQPGDLLLGWAHSHPGYGAFLSETDLRTQAQWFSQPWSVALVFDPVRKDLRCFGGVEGNQVQLVVVNEDELLQAQVREPAWWPGRAH